MMVALFEGSTELLSFVSILHLITTTYPSIIYELEFSIKGQNLVCNELAMLKIFDDVSETLFNVLDKVYISFGAR